MTEAEFRTGKTAEGLPVRAETIAPAGWPKAHRFSLLPGSPDTPARPGPSWIVMMQTGQGPYRFDVHDKALEEFVVNAQAARGGGRCQDPRIDAATGAPLPDPAEPNKPAPPAHPVPPAPAIARPLDEWHEDMGPKLWWFFPMTEAPHVGCPLDTEWPGYHTHFTDLPLLPVEPAPALAAGPNLEGQAEADKAREEWEQRRAAEQAGTGQR